MDEAGVGLAAAIEAIREELREAQKTGEQETPIFSVGKVSVELGGELKSTGKAGAGVKFWVVNVDASGDRSSSATHKVSVELVPRESNGDSFEVNQLRESGPTT